MPYAMSSFSPHPSWTTTSRPISTIAFRTTCRSKNCPTIAIQWAWQAHPEPIYTLLAACVRVGYHPRVWRTAIAVAIRKPNRKDYSLPRSYRLIQLLETMGKILEKIEASRLAYLAVERNIVPPTQFGAKLGTSTTDAIFTFDIKGFFDNVNHCRLLRTMREYRFPLPIIRWTASFLQDRQAAVCLRPLSSLSSTQQTSPSSSTPDRPRKKTSFMALLAFKPSHSSMTARSTPHPEVQPHED